MKWRKENVLLQIRQEGNAAENSCAVNSWVNIFILPLSALSARQFISYMAAAH